MPDCTKKHSTGNLSVILERSDILLITDGNFKQKGLVNIKFTIFM